MMNFKEFISGYKGKDIPKELKEFNWGAFLLTFIWGIRYKAWITLLAIPLIWFQLPFGINWILYTVLQFYCGIKGNEWAYQVEWWKKPVEFRRTQMRWAVAALSINLFIPFVMLTVAAKFIAKSKDNPLKFIQNAQCSVAYSKIRHGFQKIYYGKSSSGSEIASKFADKFPNARAEDNSVIFTVKSGGKNVDLYNLTFIRVDEGENSCSLNKHNCVIKSMYATPSELLNFSECTFYFDDKRQVVPDIETKNAIDMGLNIFKYL